MNPDGPKCRFCGEPMHTAICPKIKRIEYADDGRTWKAVEFHPPPLTSGDVKPTLADMIKDAAAKGADSEMPSYCWVCIDKQLCHQQHQCVRGNADAKP